MIAKIENPKEKTLQDEFIRIRVMQLASGK